MGMMQETDEYKSMIRQHLDLKVIETKFQKGSYSSCTLAFYRDLLLLFSNATIFFPKSSLESIAAHELRQLVLKEWKKNAHAPRPDPSTEPSDSLPSTSPSHTKRPEIETSDLFLTKNKPNVPIIVCRKRSSISSKPSSSSFSQKEEQQQSDEKKPVLELKPPVINPKEKPVTGTRSSRRSKENVTNGSAAPTKKQSSSSTSLGKMEKKKPEALAIEKKRSAADFLKRIKRNSRGEGSGGEQKGADSAGKGEKGKERVLRPNGDRKAAQKEKSSPSKRSVGRPPKKAAETNAVSAKRSREGGGKETSKRPRKRSRR